MQTLTQHEISSVNGGSDVIAWSFTGASIGVGIGGGGGTLASVMSGALTGAKWGRWGGIIGLGAGALIGAGYGYFRE